MKARGPYIKHIYWLTMEREQSLREDMNLQGIKMRTAKGVVCTPLDEINKISSVAPEVWSDTCSRQGGWYRASDKNGLYLIVSSFDIEGYDEWKAGTITLSDFTPPRYATPEEIEEMASDPELAPRIPLEWSRPKETERRIQMRWARRLDPEIPAYETLHRIHTANHANFIKPRLYVRHGEVAVTPYSIAKSALLCSCCLELFHVLGAGFPKKLVAPCPGAVTFARLPPDVYLLAESTAGSK
ncbi:MAG: hypothetical protein ACLFUE_04710 [Desulfobacteraceae bacterium]